jgi:hypothetical protein
VAFVGGSKRLFRYDAEVLETPTAVSVAALERMIEELPAGQMVTLEGHQRTVEIRLVEPWAGGDGESGREPSPGHPCRQPIERAACGVWRGHGQAWARDWGRGKQ